MEKQRLFKMTEIEQNMLIKGLHDLACLFHDEGKDFGGLNALIRKTQSAPDRKLYLEETEFQQALDALNGLRNAYLSAGRSSGGIDKVLFKLMNSKYKRVPIR